MVRGKANFILAKHVAVVHCKQNFLVDRFLFIPISYVCAWSIIFNALRIFAIFCNSLFCIWQWNLCGEKIVSLELPCRSNLVLLRCQIVSSRCEYALHPIPCERRSRSIDYVFVFVQSLLVQFPYSILIKLGGRMDLWEEKFVKTHSITDCFIF